MDSLRCVSEEGRQRRRARIDHARRGAAAVGYTPVLTPDEAALTSLAVGRLRLERTSGAYAGETGADETLLHVLVGTCTVSAETPAGWRTFEALGDRSDVFAGPSTSVLLPPGTRYTVAAQTPTADLAVANASLEAGQRPAPAAVIRPEDVRLHTIGSAHTRRTVREVCGGDGPAVRLRAGETINPTGRWSSWPHHGFAANPELAPTFEEVFLYFTRPRSGWALQRRDGLYSTLDAVDDVLLVHNGDAAVLPLGDHPIVAGVDSEVLYVWFYVSPIPKTYARWAEDLGGYA